RVFDAELPREHGFGHRGHADHRAAVAREPVDLGDGLEPRPLGDAVDAAPDLVPGRAHGVDEPRRHRRRERLGELGVQDTALASAVSRLASPRVVDQLLGDGEIAGLKARLDRADGVDADATPHAVPMKRPEIRAIVDLVRRDPALLAVACDPYDTASRDLARQDRAARRAVRGVRPRAGDDVEAERAGAAADDQAEPAAHAEPPPVPAGSTARSSVTPRQ